MNGVALLDLGGFVCAALAFVLATRIESGLPKEVRSSLLALLGSVMLLHFLDFLEWSGVEWADWFGDTFKVLIPVAWLAFLFSATRAKLTTDLRVSAQQVHLLLEETPVGIAIVSDGKWLHCNQRWLSLFQLNSPVAGTPLEASHGALGKTWGVLSRDALECGHLHHATLPATETRPALQWSLRPWFGVDGTSGAIIVITEAANANATDDDRLTPRSALEAIGAAASGVAHDINNLLTVISMHSEVLHLPQGQDPELAKSSLDSIHQAITMASSMTQGLLSFSKLKPLELEAIDLTHLVNTNARLLSDAVTERAELEVRVEPSIWVRGNMSALNQILLNLVINARDALRDRGVITVNVQSTPNGPTLTVEDTGSGIEPQVLEHMFEPFFTTKSQKGTGLGLAVVERLVRAQSAEIGVKSVVGEGTKFIITFPRFVASATGT